MDCTTAYMAQMVTTLAGAPDTPREIYHTLVNGFNGSTMLLVAGVVSALFGMFSASVFCLSVGLFLRSITEKELLKYQTPDRVLDPGTLIRCTYGLPIENAARNILNNLAIPEEEQEMLTEWKVNVLTFCDLEVWKNKLL